MVLLTTSEEWQRQSSLLLQARPTTARISVKYNVPNLQSAKYQRRKKFTKAIEREDKPTAETAQPKVPKAILCLKTYDPESGVCLQFKTDRAAEVGRLINGLGKLGRHMAALPQKTEDTVMEDAPPVETTAGQDQPAATSTDKPSVPAGGGGGGGGKKKKKGKK
ncbi:uncharacterized protein LTR77_007304 [Saxophila tyrrhenica]|uniref:SRP9 domain-containing protein n=1 Tax=Saxophila tyrrhenica TaxID=1690608 RepID=A0AAV9P8E6_9PEZI|nr:hypothetical protein LTR77_007304 [Saxophila tyrrhenica]